MTYLLFHEHPSKYPIMPVFFIGKAESYNEAIIIFNTYLKEHGMNELSKFDEHELVQFEKTSQREVNVHYYMI